jgi:hypothetical protein
MNRRSFLARGRGARGRPRDRHSGRGRSQDQHGYVWQCAHWEEGPLYDCFTDGYLPGSDRQRKEGL